MQTALKSVRNAIICSGINKTHSSTAWLRNCTFMEYTVHVVCIDKELIVHRNRFALCFTDIGIFFLLIMQRA